MLTIYNNVFFIPTAKALFDDNYQPSGEVYRYFRNFDEDLFMFHGFKH